MLWDRVQVTGEVQLITEAGIQFVPKELLWALRTETYNIPENLQFD